MNFLMLYGGVLHRAKGFLRTTVGKNSRSVVMTPEDTTLCGQPTRLMTQFYNDQHTGERPPECDECNDEMLKELTAGA